MKTRAKHQASTRGNPTRGRGRRRGRGANNETTRVVEPPREPEERREQREPEQPSESEMSDKEPLLENEPVRVEPVPETPSSILSVTSEALRTMNVDMVATFAALVVGDDGVKQWIKKSGVDGQVLMGLNAESLVKTGMTIGAAFKIAQQLEIMGCLKIPEGKLRCKMEMPHQGDDGMISLHKFEQWMKSNGVSMMSVEFRKYLMEAIGENDSWQPTIRKFNLLTPTPRSWSEAKGALMKIMYPITDALTWLTKLQAIKPLPGEKWEAYTIRFQTLAAAYSLAGKNYLNEETIILTFFSHIARSDKNIIFREKKVSHFDTLEKWITYIHENVFHFDWDTRVVRRIESTEKEMPVKNQGRFSARNRTTKPKNECVPKSQEFKKREYEEPKNEPESKRPVKEKHHCKGCDAEVYHSEDQCWDLHPELRPKNVPDKRTFQKQSKEVLKKIESVPEGQERYRGDRRGRGGYRGRGRGFNKPSSHYDDSILCPIALMAVDEQSIIMRLGLVDSGASHIFISSAFSKQILSVPIEENKHQVRLANGQVNQASKHRIFVKIQDTLKEKIAFVIEMEDEIILGRDVFDDLGIKITIPIETEREIPETIAVEKPVRGEFLVEKDEVKRLREAIAGSLEKNQATKQLPINSEEGTNFPINIPREKAKFMRQYKIRYQLRGVVTEKIEQWLKEGTIEFYQDILAHNNPLTVAPKAGGKWRVCLDFKGMNTLLQNGDIDMIPKMDEIFERIMFSGAKYFSIVDLKDAYHKLRIRKQDRWTTAFSWGGRRYNFVGAPFGIRDLTAFFSKMMCRVLDNHRDYALNYLDDIIIFSLDLKSHITHVNTVLKRLTEMNLTVNMEKCKFGYSTINLLGHTITAGKMFANREKLDVIDGWEKPQTGKEIERILGFANFFRRYLPNLETICEPLNRVRHKRRFEWDEELERAFGDLKFSLKSSKILFTPDFRYQLKLGVDSSRRGLGCFLFQDVEITDRSVPTREELQITMDENSQTSKGEGPCEGIDARMVGFPESKIIPGPVRGHPNVGGRREVGAGEEILLPNSNEDLAEAICSLPREPSDSDMNLEIDNNISIGDPEVDNNISMGESVEKSIEDFQELETPLNSNTSKSEMPMSVLSKEVEIAKQLKEIQDDVDDLSKEAGAIFKYQGKVYQRRIVALASRALKSYEKRYGITKLEGLGLVWGLRTMDMYIRGSTRAIKSLH